MPGQLQGTELAGRVALVTGAGRGIGAGIAKALARHGADVVINDVNSALPEEVAAEIRQGGRGALCAVADVSSEPDVQRMFSQIDAAFGRLDILVNNAGVGYSEDIFETSLERWKRTLDVHLTGTFLCSREAMLRMREQRWGRIIQISSVTAHQGALRGFVHYATAKAGQLGFTRTLARTAAPFGITVNAVAPGIVETEMFREAHGRKGVAEIMEKVPLGISDVDDVAAAVVFLAGEGARHITGATIDVNGGLYYR
jgi:NAD(P)-dependent dehydrogenase (short-subunit alcohol dehydrogenase family)